MKFGNAFRPKRAKRIKVEWHPTALSRDLSHQALKSIGYKVRKLKKKVV